jgi:PAS domain S-box-containing protein
VRLTGRPSAPGGSLRPFYLAVTGAWLLGAELIVITTVRGTLPRPVGAFGGGTFVVASAVLLLAVGRRDLTNRREIARLLHRHQEALASLSALTDASLAVLPLDRLLDELLVRLQEVLIVGTATIFLLAEGGDQLAVRASRGMEDLATEAVRMQLREGLAAQIATSRAPVVVDDVASSDVGPAALWGLASLAACPIVVQGRLIGLCLVGSEVRMRFTDRDIQLLQLVSDRAGVGIERSRLDEAERRSRLAAEQARRHLALLARAAETLSTALEEYEPNLAALVDVVVPEFADWCAVDVVEADGTLRRLALRHGEQRGAQCSAQFAESLIEWPALAQQAVVHGGPQLHWSRTSDSTPDRAGGAGAGGRSYLVAPIRARDQTFGVITCVTDRDRRGYRISDLSVAEELAARGAITVERVLLYREVKNSGQASERTAARWRALIEATPAGIVEVDLASRIVVWNRMAATMFGWPDGPDSSHVLPSFPESAASRITALCGRAVEGKKTLTTDLSGVAVGGHTRDLTVSAAPLMSPGGTVEGVLTLALDVTERRLLEEGMREAQRMEAIGQVAGGVAHDFNNLLTVITGYTDLVRRQSGLDESSREMLVGISDAADQASLLTGQLLTIGRRQEAKPVVLDPTAALRSLAEVLERILGIDIALHWSLDPEAGNIHIDPARFEQLVLNLAINGRDAMPAGGRLDIGSAPASLGPATAADLDLEPGRYVHITVADTGEGMDEETRRRCFEAFFTTKERSKGTGLGLAAVHGIVSEGSGVIAVSSEPGKGTRFDIYLPSSDGQVAAAVADLPPVVRTGAETVLVVEDQTDVRRLICRVLGRVGYLVLEASDGATALKISERWEGPIELVVTDVVMPDMRGPDVVDRLKRKRPSMAVLFVSGYTDGTTVPAGVAADTVGFLAKPFKPSELSARVRDVLDEHLRQARSGIRRPERS